MKEMTRRKTIKNENESKEKGRIEQQERKMKRKKFENEEEKVINGRFSKRKS